MLKEVKKSYGFVMVMLCLMLWGCSSEVNLQGIPVMTPESGRRHVMVETSDGHENVVKDFFWHGELRYIEDWQLNEFVQGLRDMAVLSSEELQQKRYANFQGEPGQWNLQQLLQAYFVPSEEVSLEHLYRDMDKPGSREIVRQTLADIEAYLKTGEAASGQAGRIGEAGTVSGW